MPLKRHCRPRNVYVPARTVGTTLPGDFLRPHRTVVTTIHRNCPKHSHRSNDTASECIRNKDNAPVGNDPAAEISAATESFRRNQSPRLSQMCAVTTTRQTDDWDIDFFQISSKSPLSLTETFHFIRAGEFSRHAYSITQLAMTMELASSNENGQNKVCFVCRDLCICLQCMSVQCERVRVHLGDVCVPVCLPASIYARVYTVYICVRVWVCVCALCV